MNHWSFSVIDSRPRFSATKPSEINRSSLDELDDEPSIAVKGNNYKILFLLESNVVDVMSNFTGTFPSYS